MAECIRKINIGTCAQRHGVIMVTLCGVLAHLYKSTESYCCHFDVGVGIGVGVTLKSFTSKLLFLAWAWLAKAKGHSCHTKKSTLAKVFTEKNE